MKTFVISLLFFSISLSGMAKHPTHISIVNMELDTDSLKINYSIRLFQDDLFYLITGLYHDELFHSTDTFDLNLNLGKIEAYFSEAFKIEANGLILKPYLIKKQNEETEFWLYYTINLNQLPKSIVIENNIFIDLYKDQTNLLIFSHNKKEKGLTFNAKVTRQVLSFENI